MDLDGNVNIMLTKFARKRTWMKCLGQTGMDTLEWGTAFDRFFQSNILTANFKPSVVLLLNIQLYMCDSSGGVCQLPVQEESRVAQPIWADIYGPFHPGPIGW